MKNKHGPLEDWSASVVNLLRDTPDREIDSSGLVNQFPHLTRLKAVHILEDLCDRGFLICVSDKSTKYSHRTYVLKGTRSPEKLEFVRVKYIDPTVNAGLKAGLSLEEIICRLSEEKEALAERILYLEGIAPRKVTMPDGRVMIYRCPDEFVTGDL